MSHAETIISSTGSLAGHETLGSSGIDQILYASWTQTSEYDGLDVLAELLRRVDQYFGVSLPDDPWGPAQRLRNK